MMQTASCKTTATSSHIHGPLSIYRFSVGDYHRMIDAGILNFQAQS